MLEEKKIFEGESQTDVQRGNENAFKRKFGENLDLIVAVGGMLFGLFIISLSLMSYLNQWDIGLVIFSACSIYLVFRNRFKEIRPLLQVKLSQRHKLLLNIVFFIIFSITVLLWYNQLYQRPISYFVLISVLVGILAVEILGFDSKKDHAWMILLKIFLLSASIRIGIFYNFPSIMGYDAYLHAKIADVIANTGVLPPFEVMGKYFYYPILHIFVSTTEIMCQTDIKNAIFFSIGIISIISTIFVYLIGKKLASAQIGLLAALLLNVTNYIIARGVTNFTAGSLVLCYFMMILYLVFKEENKTINASIIIFITLLIIMTHQLTVFASFIALASIYFGKCLHKIILDSENIKKSWLYVNKHYVLIFAISMQTYWMYSYSRPEISFFDQVLLSLIHVLQSGGKYGPNVLVVGQTYPMQLWEILLLHSSYLILPFFAIGGIILWSSSKDNKKFSIVTAACILYVLGYGIPLLGIRNFLTDRWMPILSVFSVLVASAYILGLIKLISSNRNKLFVIFAIPCIFSFFMTTAPGVNKDNPIVAKDTTVRNQFMDSEISGAKTTIGIWDGQIKVDSSFLNLYVFQLNTSKYLENAYIPFISGFESETDLGKKLMFVLRKSTSKEPVVVGADPSGLYGLHMIKPLSEEFFDRFESSNYDKVYDNGQVLGYVSK